MQVTQSSILCAVYVILFSIIINTAMSRWAWCGIPEILAAELAQ